MNVGNPFGTIAAMAGALGGTMIPGMGKVPKGSTPNKYWNHPKFGGAKEIARRKARREKLNGTV